MMSEEEIRQIAEENAVLREAMAERDKEIVARDEKISALGEKIAERDGKISALGEKIAERDGKISALDEKIVELDGTIARLGEKIESLKDSIAWLRKKLFGKMSEKNLPLDPAQLLLFETEETGEEEKSAEEEEVTKAEEAMSESIAQRRKPVRRQLDLSGLPVKEEHIYPDGTADETGRLKDEYVEIGTEETSRLERTPAKVYVVKTIRHKVISKEDMSAKHPEDRRILVPELPPAPISKGMAGASVLADIIIEKFSYHLPFHRTIQKYREAGISISDSTIGGWYEAGVESLKLIYDLLRHRIMASEYIQIDESVVPVIDNERHKARKGYEWCVRDGITGDVMFWYDRGSRGGAVARELLCGYKGNVQSDGYEAYNQFERREGIVMYGCWAHVRRKFSDALDEDRVRATEGICRIGKLYKVEAEADEAGLSPEERRDKRKKESYPAILDFEKWLLSTYPHVLPKSRMGKAIEYAYTLLPRLSRYVNDGRVNIDNNLIENAIRPLAIGRKNYLFCGNDASAYRAAIVYSLIGTCKAAGVDPREWMEDALRRIPCLLRGRKDLSCLLPREWASSRLAKCE